MYKKLSYSILCLLIQTATALAQIDTTAYKHLGVGIGMNLTKTDLSERYQKPTSSIIAYLQFAKEKKFNSAIYLTIGQAISENPKVKLLDQSQYQINSFALTNYQSLHFKGIYNLFRKKNWTITLSQGLGFMRFNVYDENDALLVNKLNSRAQGESYSGFAVLVPSSFSVSYLLKNGYGLNAQFTMQNSITDYLDNISIFGNESNNDNIMSFEITVFKRLTF